MIIDLPSTTSSSINKKLVELRERGGANAQGRVLTLVIVTDEGAGEDAIAAANGASFEHPCRVIVVALGSKRGTARLDAQIRVGGDAGASEVVVLRLFGALVDHGAAVVVPLLLPDAPVVAWWPGEAPEVPAEDPIGRLAQRRITDANTAKRPLAQLELRAKSYRPGDTDLAWTRLTAWRGLLASALDQPPHQKIVSATVTSAPDSVSGELLAGWLALQLRIPVTRIKAGPAGAGLRSVELFARNGEVSLSRPDGATATLTVTGHPSRQLPLPHRILRDCIAEELRRLDADDVYADVLIKGIPLLDKAARSIKAPRSTARTATPAKATRRTAVGAATAAPAKATGRKAAAPSTAAPKRAAKPAATSAAPKAAPKATAAKATAPKAAAKAAAPKAAAAKAAASGTAPKAAAAKATAKPAAPKATAAKAATPKAATAKTAKPTESKAAAAKAAPKAAAAKAAGTTAIPKAAAAKTASAKTPAAKATGRRTPVRTASVAAPATAQGATAEADRTPAPTPTEQGAAS